MAIEDRKGRNVIDIRHLRELFDVRSMVKMYDNFYTLRIMTPPLETPDPPNDTAGALKQVVLKPHDIPWSLRVYANSYPNPGPQIKVPLVK